MQNGLRSMRAIHYFHDDDGDDDGDDDDDDDEDSHSSLEHGCL